MNFLITGKIKPYVRMTQRSKFADPQAQEYLASRDAIRVQLKQQMIGLSGLNSTAMLPRSAPLRLDVHFQLPLPHSCDLDNLIKAVCDAMNGVVFLDDRWIDEIHATAGKGEPLANVMVTLRSMT